MFTGIVQEVGAVVSTRPTDQGLFVEIEAPKSASQLALGDSICTHGVCLTCVERSGDRFFVDVSAETLRRTNLSSLAPGSRVNLELALRMGDRLGGHLVTGHVDGVGRLLSVVEEGESRLYTFEAPENVMRFVVEKGSIAVDGVSLTVAGVEESALRVALIPHTLKVTTLGTLRVGETVNLEADLIGKYVARLLEPAHTAAKAEG